MVLKKSHPYRLCFSILNGKIFFFNFIIQAKCPTISIQNGKVQMSKRGKMITFECLNKFTLVGSRHSVCTRGKWDTPAPVCISKFIFKLNNK